ncbi:hypothetical protein [Rhodoferax sp.]|uniref:hypothetical protein n=1 Tax=Rhodoferax sp. TaxID=50421 RepID=UPI0025D4D096|nr:hypothetical protein [Rhodoferax sp.]
MAGEDNGPILAAICLRSWPMMPGKWPIRQAFSIHGNMLAPTYFPETRYEPHSFPRRPH